MELFILDGVDYTEHIVVPSYKVQSEPVTKTWEDALYTTHIDTVREKLQGSFKIYFDSIDELNAFLNKLINLKDVDNYTPATLYDNWYRNKKTSKFYFKLSLINDKPYYGTKKHDGYEIQVEEK